MTKVIVNAELARKLHNLTMELELCDENGKVLARYSPSTPWNDPENWLPNPGPTDEEIVRRLSSNERTYTTQELIEMIKAL